MSNSVQLTDIFSYDPSNLVLPDEPVTSEFKNSEDDKGGMKFQRLYVKTKYPPNHRGVQSEGDLIFSTGEVFSFGIQENTSKETQRVTGHQMALNLWSRNRETKKFQPTEDQLEWTDKFNTVVETIKQHVAKLQSEGKLLSTYRKLKPEQFSVFLMKFDPLYWGKDMDGPEPVEGDVGSYDNGPSLYAKLIEYRPKTKKGEKSPPQAQDGSDMKVYTEFYDENDEPIADPRKALNGKYCTVEAAVKIESVFINAKTISLQIKLYEAANIKIIQNEHRRLIQRPASSGRSLLKNAMTTFSGPAKDTTESEPQEAEIGQDHQNDDNESDTGSLIDEDEEQTQPYSQEPKKIPASATSTMTKPKRKIKRVPVTSS